MLRDKLADIAMRFSLQPEARNELEDLIQLALVDSFRATAVPVVTHGPPDTSNRPPETIVHGEDAFEDLPPGILGWIPLGRDPLLEQRILNNIAGRLHGL